MFGLFRRAAETTVRFCERYGELCGALCRGDAIRERALQRAFVVNGWRQM